MKPARDGERDMIRTISSLLLASIIAAPAFAATATSSLNVTASVGPVCSISTLPVAFGAYDPVGTNASANLNGTGTVTVACTKGASASVDLGNGGSFLASSRRMSSGTDFLSYALYKDSAQQQPWGSGVTGGTTASYVAANKNSASLTVYGAVGSGQDVSVGSYSDSIVATINY